MHNLMYLFATIFLIIFVPYYLGRFINKFAKIEKDEYLDCDEFWGIGASFIGSIYVIGIVLYFLFLLAISGH